MPHCPHCARQTTAGWTHCPECGASLAPRDERTTYVDVSGPAAAGPARSRTPLVLAGAGLAAVLLLVAVGVGTFLALRPAAPAPVVVAASSGSTQAAATTTTAAVAAAPSTTTTTRSAPTPTGIGSSRAEQAVRAYYALLPSSLSAAYQGLGPGLSSQVSVAEYTEFWSGFTRVDLTAVSASGDGRTVEVTVVFTRPTSTTVEDHRLGMSTDAAGRVLIDSDLMETTQTY